MSNAFLDDCDNKRWRKGEIHGIRRVKADSRRYAEMDKTEKNKISHRGKALDKLKAWLRDEVDA